MDMTGEQLIALPQQRVWEALNDPQVLKDCIPGCETMEKVSDTEYRVVLSAAVGPVKAKFNGKLLLSDLNPPNSYALSFEGSGGAAGFGKGDCKVSLSQADGATRLALHLPRDDRWEAGAGRLPLDRRRGAQDGRRFLRQVQREGGTGGAAGRPQQPPQANRGFRYGPG